MKAKRWLGILMAILMMVALAVPAYAVPGDELISNGGFEGTNELITGDTTDYTEVTEIYQNSMEPPYVYAIGEDPNDYHSAWESFDAHGGNKMMIVNGTSEENPGALVWSQEVMLPECISTELSFPLYTGRMLNEVGEVLVTSDGENICVTFVLDEAAEDVGWLITETHVAIADEEEGIPQKNGNPIPGQFDNFEDGDPWVGESEYLDPGVLVAGPYCLEIGDGWKAPYAIAAHAVIERTECIEVVAAGSADVVSDESTMVTVGNLGTEPHLAVISTPEPGYPADTWTNATGSTGWAIPAPEWIWEADTEVNPRDGDIVTFEKTFNIPGVPADSTLKIAVDNGYAVWVNGNFIGSDNLLEGIGWDGVTPKTEAEIRAELTALTQDYVDTTTWQDEATFIIPAAYLITGENILKILAVNEYSDVDDGNPLATTENGKNPAGVVFYLEANWDALTECTSYDETAWGGDEEFDGKNWARYIEFDPPVCENLFDFSFWASSSYPDAPAQLEVTINDVVIGTLDLTGVVGQWDQFTETGIDLTGETIARIEIRDWRYAYTGDDFCIDDISFKQQP